MLSLSAKERLSDAPILHSRKRKTPRSIGYRAVQSGSYLPSSISNHPVEKRLSVGPYRNSVTIRSPGLRSDAIVVAVPTIVIHALLPSAISVSAVSWRNAVAASVPIRTIRTIRNGRVVIPIDWLWSMLDHLHHLSPSRLSQPGLRRLIPPLIHPTRRRRSDIPWTIAAITNNRHELLRLRCSQCDRQDTGNDLEQHINTPARTKSSVTAKERYEHAQAAAQHARG
jgi:hypothetical protein